MDLTFISNHYQSSEMDLYHQDIRRLMSLLLSVEPFHTRAGQISVHYVDNTQDLGCDQNLNNCDDITATQLVNSAGAPHDIIVMLTKIDVGTSNTGNYVIHQANGTDSDKIFAHEIGHAVSRHTITEEYSGFNSPWGEDPGPIDNQVHGNCFAGIPPAPAWQNLVALDDYRQGCQYVNWYRSSQTSFMLEVQNIVPYYNAVSQILLNNGLDYFAGSFPDNILPAIQIIAPGSGASLSGIANITTNASDNNGVAWVQLWVDGVLNQTVYSSPFTIPWNTYHASNGSHQLQVKVSDVQGNTGTSQTVSVTVNNTPDITPPVINIAVPVDGAIVGVDRYATFAVTAADDTEISKVEFYVDNQLISTKVRGALPPLYLTDWDLGPVINGAHRLSAKAYDISGNQANSSTITVTYQGGTSNKDLEINDKGVQIDSIDQISL